jgi:hypothetical protein
MVTFCETAETIEKVTVAVVACEALLATSMVMVAVEVAVGVPLITPVVVLKLRPAGS